MNANTEVRTLADLFFRTVERNQPCVMLYERDSQWQAISSSELYRRVMGVVQELRRLGVGRQQRVAILSENRPEWTIADFAILLCGAVTVPIYPTLTPSQISFLLRDSQATLAFVSNAEQFAKLRSIQPETFIERVILMDPPPPDSGALPMSAFMEAGPAQRSPQTDALAVPIAPGDLATIIYTSGTTGVPKGVMLSHGNIASNLSVSLKAFDLRPQLDLAISFLPLSHITARHVDVAELYLGVTIAYCPVIDDLPRIMREMHPTFFVAVPRVYEKIRSKVLRQTASAFKHRLFQWAMAVGRVHLQEVLAGRRPGSPAWKLANRLVYSKVRAAMGGKVRIFASGGAPLGIELAEWYAQLGIVIHEGYGLTETSPVIALNVPGAHKLGTVGRPLSNVEVRIAPDNELLVRGPSVFHGYWNAPEETAAAFDGDWFKTGDIAHLDRDGFLSVTDRKKDLIKTSGGKFIAPQPIECSFKNSVFVSEAILIGDRRRFPAVVLFPAFGELESWAQQAGLAFRSRAELVAHPRVQGLYTGIVEEVNRSLARFEQIKRFLLLHEELSIEEGTLTPTLKLRRRSVEDRYREKIEKLYTDPAPPAPPIPIPAPEPAAAIIPTPTDAAHSA